jgi:hypothetical protein
MPNRAAKFRFAMLASLVSVTALVMLSNGAARAADDCLAAPKDQTPEGSHWYYRIDHATKRHCWYLRQEGERPPQTAAAGAPRSPMPIVPSVPKQAAPTQRSIADAHAELPARTTIEPPPRDSAPTPVMPAAAADSENNAGAQAQQSVVASRWPDPSTVIAVANPPPVTEHLAPPPVTERLAANDQPDPAAAPPTAVAETAPAAMDSSRGRIASVPMLLVVMTGALALAGITASVVLKLGAARRRVRRDKIWQARRDDSGARSARRGADVLPRRAAFPRDLDRTGDDDDRVAEFFSHLSKRTPT